MAVVIATGLMVKLSPYITHIHTIDARADVVVRKHPSVHLSQSDFYLKLMWKLEILALMKKSLRRLPLSVFEVQLSK